MPTEGPPLAAEVSANVCGYRVPRGQRDGSLRQYSRLSRPVTICHNIDFSSFIVFYFADRSDHAISARSSGVLTDNIIILLLLSWLFQNEFQ
jgi:hypothetical protein